MAKKYDVFRNQNSGFFQDLILRVKLIVRLMGDKRVNILLKLLPVAALIYLVSPVDFLPGVVFPFIGALDDMAVLWLGATLFVNLCPDEVVQEHMNAMQKVVMGTWRESTEQDGSGEVLEAEAYDAPQDQQ